MMTVKDREEEINWLTDQLILRLSNNALSVIVLNDVEW
jgi:hypothetical protein